MYNEAKMIYIKMLTPTHAGAGQTLQNVDMPIQRETNTNIPKIEGSSLKGSIKHSIYRLLTSERNKATNEKEKKEESVKLDTLDKIFGSEDGDSASRIGFTDAKLLFFPIKSATKIYKLITCPYILKRWIDDLQYVKGCYNDNIKEIDDKINNINEINVNEGKCISNETDNNKEKEKSQILEEYIFDNLTIKKDKDVIADICDVLKSNNIKTEELKERMVILNDTDFIDLVSMYTEIITRNKIDPDLGTAEKTGLFTEEYLPTETIMYFMALSSPEFNKNIGDKTGNPFEYLNDKLEEVFHIGGFATIGKGFVKWLNKSDFCKKESSDKL
ncbi:type III-B CRISPR module RAMP protein Cmr4 [Anaerovorax odorimutans]|uniref:type III-B CRISPR module RAMP protein Cmr4 n=1 Tax=Anaerovorax odorimutans TaxID=109327 RepID=UPI0003F626C6|nr:type III-B CRISPR module RAMP protein Cmr4 [Anaerovorax odorimutans]